MGMSETEYSRVVEELKHGRRDPRDETIKLQEELIGSYRDEIRKVNAGLDKMNTWYAINGIGRAGADAWPQHAGASDLRQRGYDLGNRCDALSPAQFTTDIRDTVRRLGAHLREGEHSVEAYNFALDQIEREIRAAEQRPR